MPSLWDLVDKKEEPQKEVKEETPEVVEATPVAKEEKPKTTKAAKTTAKKETKKKEEKPQTTKEPLTVEEQIIANKDPNLAKVINHLVNMDGMEEKMNNPGKSFKDMWNFIQQKARKKAISGCTVIEDAEVYGWAVHYYDEENPE